MKVRIVKEVKMSDGLWRFACGDVFIRSLHCGPHAPSRDLSPSHLFQTKHWRWPLCRWPWGAGWPYKVREGPKIRDLNLTVTRLRGRQKYCTTVSFYALEPQHFVPYSAFSMLWSGSHFTTVHKRTRARLTCWPYKVDKPDTNLLSLPACSFALKLVTFGWFLFLRYLQTFFIGQREPFCCIALNASWP